MFKSLMVVGFTLIVVTVVAFHAKVHADPVAQPAADPCRSLNFSDAWPCYREQQASWPWRYKKLPPPAVQPPDVKKTSYEMTSQQWPEGGGARPEVWTHQVDVYVPEKTSTARALLVINNGTNVAKDQAKEDSSPPTDFDEDILANLARQTHMVVISLAYEPNQYVQLPGDSQQREEDDLIGETWERFLDHPQQNRTLPLHVPMAEAAVHAMDLAQRELTPEQVRSFVVTGVSKRAWATWLVPLGDQRVDAVVPFVIGMHIEPLIPYINKSYGGAWPIALRDYYNHGILGRYQTPEFDQLMQVEDPYKYLSSRYGERLRIPKYIVNASGDDFFPPDVSRFYIDKLQGETGERVVPNSDHYGIKQHLQEALIPTLQRWNEGRSIPVVHSKWNVGARLELSASSSEAPESARVWVAENASARDFRYACGVRYKEMPATISHGKVTVEVDKPDSGWLAMFTELTYADSFVATTPVYIYPEQAFPSAPPPDQGPSCSTVGKPGLVPSR
ncbi:PhoPQ-activated protein PqaA family protein [Dyella flagellata]|uniref:PhoPQ-regulated protein n=1 Tax=Dyella flagellata TaxID=1867833 RepID=A0ABQ5X531_9GAMM|nr:PhoPQ-activated protein PqaA family protein [Dyella flagellata]GLQ86725.1 PhoPQ-regulated protein [Dyella flagellata]